MEFITFELDQTAFFIYNAVIFTIFVLIYIAFKSSAEKRFRSLIEYGLDVISITNPNTEVLYISPSIERVLGYDPEEFKRLAVLKLIHPDDLERVMRVRSQLISRPKEAQTLEFRFRHQNGTWRWIESTAINLIDVRSIKGIVSNFRDVTQKKQLDQAKSDFFWMTAHQLRTPLSNMKWNLELIEKQDLSVKELERILNLKKHTLRMITQVDEILNASHLQQFQFKDEPKPTNVIGIVKGVIKDMESDIQKKEVKVLFECNETSIPIIKMSQHHFTEVIQNLISNAIKYNKQKGGVEIKLYKVDERLEFSIEDTGIGIPKEEQAKLFSRFFRATNVQDSDGTGLGLSLIKSYIEDWGGNIWFKSEINIGSSFYFDIPISN